MRETAAALSSTAGIQNWECMGILQWLLEGSGWIDSPGSVEIWHARVTGRMQDHFTTDQLITHK